MRIFFDEQITQYRLVQDATSSTEKYQLHGYINGAIRPVKAEDLMLADGVPYETFKLYCEDYTDIQEGDKIYSVLYDGAIYKNLQNEEVNNTTEADTSKISIKTTNEYVVKTVKRYGLKNIQRVECYLTLLKQ
jgi:hypothetical protein